MRCFPTTRGSSGCPPISSSSTWNRTASGSRMKRRDGDERHRAGRLRRARHQRPARLLPAPPPGHGRHPVRFPRRGAFRHRQRRRRPPRAAPRQLPGAERGADARTHRRRGARRDEGRRQDVPATIIETLAPHKVFPGNRPSNTILYRRLDLETLGKLIALYEHKVFVQGVIWGINSFDQWGVELGKVLAKELLPMVEGKAPAVGRDGSTLGLLDAIRLFRTL